MHTLLGTKKGQVQKFLADGNRIPVTLVAVGVNPVIRVKTTTTDGYNAVQIGLGQKKKANKAELGNSKKGAGLTYAPSFLAEVRFPEDATTDTMPKVGDKISPDTVLALGDMVDVSGISKGKGFAGVVKRHNFKGGPRTHGQSDRERAPGSVGQTTTPGRVYRGKRMAGKMGFAKVTVKNLEVVAISADGMLSIRGLIPGALGATIMITKTNKKNKKFMEMAKDVDTSVKTAEITEEKEPIVEEAQVEEAKEEAKV